MTAWPPVPDYLTMPRQYELIFLAVVSLFAAFGLGWAILRWRRSGDRLPAAALAGGTACAILEPLVDILGQCWHPRGQMIEAFELMGRPIPLWVVVGYGMAFGLYTIFTMEVLERKGPQALWSTWIGGILFMGIFDVLAVTTKVYVYYGAQPLRFLDLPLWWEPVNGLLPVTAAVILASCRQWLTGRRILLVIPMLLMVDAAVYAAAALPAYIVLKSDVPEFVLQAAGVVTLVNAAFMVFAAAKFAEFMRVGTSNRAGALEPV